MLDIIQDRRQDASTTEQPVPEAIELVDVVLGNLGARRLAVAGDAGLDVDFELGGALAGLLGPGGGSGAVSTASNRWPWQRVWIETIRHPTRFVACLRAGFPICSYLRVRILSAPAGVSLGTRPSLDCRGPLRPPEKEEPVRVRCLPISIAWFSACRLSMLDRPPPRSRSSITKPREMKHSFLGRGSLKIGSRNWQCQPLLVSGAFEFSC